MLAVPDDMRWTHATHTPVLLAISVAVVGLHGAGVILVDRALQRFERPRLIVWLVLAGAFGLGWQDTLLRGDGIRASDYYDALRVIGAIAAPIFVATYVYVVGFAPRGPLWARRVLAALTAVIGFVGVQFVFTDYVQFHAYLVLFVAGNLVWAVAPWGRSRAVAISGWTLLACSLAAVAVVPNWMSGQRATQRYSEAPAALLWLPWTESLQVPAESVLNPDATLTSQGIAAIRRSVQGLRAELGGEPRGSNVLLIVLESTRSDTWSQPAIAPNFHRWKKHGLYVPRAVAQYPATPLAYGAMFTSQPPSVLTQTPAWAESRLFDLLSLRFDHLVLSRPKNRWFDKEAITDFFVDDDTPVAKHTSTADGLSNLRKSIGAIEESDSFFAWTHLYEPHQPWVKQPEFMRSTGSRAAYESEVSLVDSELGKFMDWFFEQPFADETLVVIIADHGEGLGERVRGKKFFGHHVHVRNMVSHVPAFFAGPGIPKGVTNTEVPFAQIDMMPTLFDFLGEDLPEETMAQGRSLFASLEDPEPRALVTEAFSIRGKQFFEFVQAVRKSNASKARERFREVSSSGTYAPKVALQYGRHKVIRDMLLQETQLFDILEDPEELVDLADKDPKTLADLEAKLAEWRARQTWVIRQLETETALAP